MNKVRLKVDGAKLTKIRESAIISCGKKPAPGPEPMRGSATAASSTNGSAGKTVSDQAHYSHRHPAQPAPSFILIPACARLQLRECCTCSHGLSIWRRVRGRIQLAALVSGIVVPPQPDPDVTQARCSSIGCPATPDGSPWHTRCLRWACPPSSFTAKPAVLAALGGIVAVRLGHTLTAVAILRSLASTSPLIDIARAQNPA